MNTFSNEKRQYFYEEIKARFYLRKPKSKRPTRIFLVVYIGGKQHRYPTQVRVYPSQWNSKKQLAVVSNVQSEQDNRNNIIVNEHLTKLRHYFSEYIEYICNNDVTDIAKTLKQFIYRGMAKKNKRKNIYDVIPNALEHYHKYVKPSIKDSTKRQNESLLSEFRRFLDTIPSKDRTMQIFSQKGLNRYKQYLIDKMERSKTDGKMRNFGVGQLNRCGAIVALLINRVLVEKEDDINPVVWNKVDDPRREDQIGHIPLLDNEVVAIENCSGLTDVEEEYRNLFLLQLECGQRVSDIAKILTGKYNMEQGKKYKYIVLSTIKENIKAYIPLTPRMTMLMERVKAHKLVDPIEFEKKTKGKGNGTYNEAIRRIAKKADLCREIVKINASQTEVRKPLYETITSHDARCTFITNMIKKGVSPERLCKMTGHARDEMIKRVYAQLSDADEICRIESDLYSDVDEDGGNQLVDTSSFSPNESEAAVTKEVPNQILNDTNKMPTVLFNSNRPNDLKSYIIGLKDIVDTSTEKADDDNLVCNELLNQLKQRSTDIPSEEDKPRDRSKIKDLLTMPEDDLSIIMEATIVALEERIKESKQAKELGLSLLISKFSSYYILQRRVTIFANLFDKIIPYMMYNRPIVNENLLVSIKRQRLNRIPDLTLVLRELQKVSGTKLEMIIKYTDCPRDVQIRLLNAIVRGDLAEFTNKISTFERETRVIINYAYNLDYVNNVLLNRDGLTDPASIYNEEGVDFFVDQMQLEDPFLSENAKTPIAPEITSAGLFHKDSIISFWGKLFDFFQDIQNQANLSEKRILSKVLKQIEKYPELSDTYDKFITTQEAISDDESIIEDTKNKKTKISKKKSIVAFEDLVIFKSEIDYASYPSHETLSTLDANIAKRGDGVFKEFINYLAFSSCIDNNDYIKQLLTYRFTGACRPEGDLEKIPWNPDKLNELAYVIMYSTVRSKGKYEKVREFFEGPRFPADISIIRTYANSAPQDFRVKLNNLYPDVFAFKV